MKTLLTLSTISSVPIILFGVVIPSTWLMSSPEHINIDFIWVCMCIYVLALSIVMTTALTMFRYIEDINNLEESKKEYLEEKILMQKIREKYERLIEQEGV